MYLTRTSIAKMSISCIPLMIIEIGEVMKEYFEEDIENIVAIRFADNTEFELPITNTALCPL